MGLFSERKRSYRAAAQVERYRAAAQELRGNDPDHYSQIVHQAQGSEAVAAAREDPDAYVALFLSAAEEAGVIDGDGRILVRGPAMSHEADVAAVLEALGPRLERLATSPEGEPLQYPDWAGRTLLKMELADLLGLMGDVAAETEPSGQASDQASKRAPDRSLCSDTSLERHRRIRSCGNRVTNKEHGATLTTAPDGTPTHSQSGNNP
jgi:hypothetical protein